MADKKAVHMIPPDGRGPGAYFQPHHVERMRAIGWLLAEPDGEADGEADGGSRNQVPIIEVDSDSKE